MRWSSALCVFLGACTAQDGQPEEKLSASSQEIINGTPYDAENSGFVMMASNGSLCSATLLNREWVLTAKHCNVVAGATAYMGSQTRTVNQVINHSSLDVTLAHLQSPMTWSSSYAYTVRALRTTPLAVGEAVQCYGYGLNTFDTGAGTLRTAPLSLNSLSASEYNFDRNGSGQVQWKGDSGGTCVDSAGRAVSVTSYCWYGGNNEVYSCASVRSDVFASWANDAIKPPASCQDIKNANPSAADGEYTLYVGNDESRSWKAWCSNMAGTPAEYLPLTSTGPSLNFSQYTAGYNNGGGTDVRTLFTKVRIDPTTLVVSTGDQTFSTSSGLLWHGGAVTSMSYAAAMNCDFGNPGLGNVDLRGTPFSVAPNQFVAVGYYASGGATYSSNNQVVDLWNRGECGWMSVQGADHPFNGRNFQLQLQYAPLPASCQDIKNANPSAADGEYTLYVGRNVSRPWKAWCGNMAGTPAEYLSLPSTGASSNFSQYTAGNNNGGGTNVRTVFSKVRIDPTTLRVSTGDQSFSTSSGYLTHPYSTPVSSMPYAAAMNCDFGNPGLGNVDLRGTPFSVAPNQFVAVGYYASGSATYSANNQVVDLQGRGECGWMSALAADNPFNNRGFPLQLQYAQ